MNSDSAIHRVLVVDDYAPWCRFISSTLQERARWQIVDEVSDGAEAVKRAAALHPDLILLDIGLPTINGIEAARRIIDGNRDARILFVSEHRSWDIAEAALATGARGYVIKSDAVRELLPAMNAIVNGGRFVSAALAGRGLEETNGGGLGRSACIHEALFCSRDDHLLEEWVRFAHERLQAGDAVIIVSTAERRAQIRARLEALGVDVRGAIGTRRYQSLDVAEGLQRFMVDGWPEETHFWQAAASLVMDAGRAASRTPPRIALCGEVAPTLWRQGRGDAAVQLERLWHEFSQTYNIDTLCGFASRRVYPDPRGDFFRDICAVHTAVHSR